MGSVGAKRAGGGALNNRPPVEETISVIPWTKAGYDMYDAEIRGSTEIWYNPDAHKIVFLSNEAPVTPIFSGYAEGVSGTDAQLKKFLENLWAGRRVVVTRRF